MLVMDGRAAPGRRSWNLRIGLTSRCNIRCRYCLPDGRQDVVVQPTLAELTAVLQAAHEVGIRRVHYTGGEPTVRRDFLAVLRAAQEIGFAQQIVTTNGYRLHRIIEEAIDSGLTRAIVSLDTLDETQNKFLTRAKFLKDTIQSVERAVALLPTLTKISSVTMRSTLKELPKFVRWAADLNSRGQAGRLAIKLNQFFPSNPAQLSGEGEEFWKTEFASEEMILEALSSVGELKPIERTSVEGDNPSYNYYEIGDTGVMVAVLAMFSWGYPCGGCHKLRISPQGLATVCIGQQDPPVIWGMNYEEKLATFKRLTDYRESDQFEKDFRDRVHYRAQLGELRFDSVVGPEKDIVEFRDILARHQEERGRAAVAADGVSEQ
ncbi:GTP 3',8-cyclase MoaA [Frankia sp. AgKG'84/4]|uniref:GTP 3',8-cyclase MoaA n=1 Tax=Frankia sp. AgKG'84/4 TaxID=573490 RepID=UPI00200CDD83|nr:GTP 3',8-cyclase MoaA [Frankia sp. AgKG'84/4]MCL9792969.1 radical SAM protein [Frankia sp. AgKG'84/4]